jgi:hypothetical protein
MTLAEAKAVYNVLHVFGGENSKEIKKDFDAFLDSKVSDALYKYHKEKGEPLDLFTIPLFQDTIKKIVRLDCDIEIIGHWIYCFKAGKVKNELEQNGFWYSSKFRAWIFSGKKKRRYATKLKLSDLRNGNY